MFWFLLSLFLMYMLGKLFMKISFGVCESNAKMNGKVVIITGANAGIGFETAKDLARRGARVILACRSEQRGTHARNMIIEATGNKEVVFKKLDLTSFKSVRQFAQDILDTEPRLDVLINNAGIAKIDALTEDNLDVEKQVNYFGPFLLTNLLLPKLKQSAPSRIINLSSILHVLGKIDHTLPLPPPNKLRRWRVYADMKLANILFTAKLGDMLKGTGVTANCLHPGAVRTEIFQNLNIVLQLYAKLFFKTPYEGAQTTIYLAVAPEVQEVTGKYFKDCRVTSGPKDAQNRELVDYLYNMSAEVVKINAS